jgi:phosphoglycolate phosphatase-like HAD superfamily hydrolase
VKRIEARPGGTPLTFEQVVVEVTQACHHRCVHCYNFWSQHRAPVRHPETLSRREILALVRKIRRVTPLRQVGLSGGEPLLRPDLPEIARDLSAEGLGVVVITNATLLTDELLDRFPLGVLFEFTLFSVDAELHDRIPLLPKRRPPWPRPPKERQVLPVDIPAPLRKYRAMLDETQKPILPHPRSAEYMRERKKHIPISQ